MSKGVGEVVLVDLFNTSLPQTFNLKKRKKKAISVKNSKMKCSKMRHACIISQLKNKSFLPKGVLLLIDGLVNLFISLFTP